MPLTLYAHPFASYCWKVLIALYENATPFTYRAVEDAAAWAELESLWPIKKFPLLRDDDSTIAESSIIVEYLMRRYPGTTQFIPENDDASLRVRFMDRFFDNYVMTPMSTLVSNRLRLENERDPKGDADARKMLDVAYGWLAFIDPAHIFSQKLSLERIRSSGYITVTFSLLLCYRNGYVILMVWI